MMTLRHRRRTSARWSLMAASLLATAAAYVAWRLFFQEKSGSYTDDELREIEAFEEYERRKSGGA